MSKFVKYILIAAASLGVLIIIGIVAVTMLVDVQSYKPKIEQLVTEKTGYPLTLGGDIDLSFFPWIGLRLTDLRLDNPKGFANKNFVHIDTFQARVKVLPLLSRKIEISKFIVNKPEILLVRNPQGVWNWQKLTEGSKAKPTTPAPAQSPQKTKPPATAGGKTNKQPSSESEGQNNGFVLQSLNVGEFAITDGRIGIDDQTSKMKHEVSNFNLNLDNVSLDKPVKLAMDARLDGKPLSLKGTVGPLGSDPGADKINLDFAVQALDTLKIQTSGYLDDLKGQKKYMLAVNVEPFNLKELFSSLDLKLPVTTADPKALEKIAVKATATGDANQVALSDSTVKLDDTTVNLNLTAKDFARPDVAFNVAVDTIDLDRYLPPSQAKDTSASGQHKAGKPETSGQTAPEQTSQAAGGATTGKASTASQPPKAAAAVNYEPLRKLVLKGNMKVGKMKVHGGNFSNLALDVAGRNGIFTLNSLGMDLYEGNIAGTGKLNVQKNTPVTALDVTMQNVQIGPLLKDFAQKDIIEGRLKAEVNVNMQGDSADLIKQSLNGKGDLLFRDGALIGLDLAQLVRTIKQGFTLEQQGERPKTDFAELHAPFTITNGLVDTSGTTLQSPFIRANVTGTANLASEALDMKIKPTLVGTIKGQGDEKERSGLTVPIVVTGTFNAPKFRPDVESLVKEQLPTEKELNEMIKSGKVPTERKEKLKKDIEQTKGLLKGLFGK